MTTTSAAKRALTPDPAQVAEFRQQLGGRPEHVYAFVAGYLTGIVKGLASDHRCRKPDCLTCARLRRGLALVTAMDAVEGDWLTGDPS